MPIAAPMISALVGALTDDSFIGRSLDHIQTRQMRVRETEIPPLLHARRTL
ncbi:MAG TPA: hypothetical protein IGS53_00970 [Leptolyngbyaceae cyanobacterium M33_DOE_097]|nr:hypothetical protein [Leptolyngbyaceae cyanobacterium M33_DOE_097]